MVMGTLERGEGCVGALHGARPPRQRSGCSARGCPAWWGGSGLAHPHPSPLQVNVFGFGADSRGNWHHYWENNRYAGEFRKTGVHDADFEAHIIDMLAKTSKIEVYRGN